MAVALAVFWILGAPGDFDASATRSPRIERLVPHLARPVPAAAPRRRAGGAEAAAVHHDLHRRPRRRRARRDRRARPRRSPSPTPTRCRAAWRCSRASGWRWPTATSPAPATPAIDRSDSRGGMESMLGTVWLIITALAFGGVVEKAGVLDRLIAPVIAAAKSVGALVAYLVTAVFATNVHHRRPVHRHRAARAACSSAPSRARPGAGRVVARHRRFRHRHLGADSLEQLRRLHGRDPRRRDLTTRPSPSSISSAR